MTRQRERLERWCRGGVAEGARVVSRYALASETDLPVWVCRGLERPVRELWPMIRHYQ